jgi:hypothetical protein
MSSAFVRTGTVLDRILERKAEDVAARKLERPLADVRREAERQRRRGISPARCGEIPWR